MTQKSLSQVNHLTEDEFVTLLGPCFEHSDWIAVETYKKGPFKSIEDLYKCMVDTIKQASQEKRLALVRAHPDLVSTKILTKHSQNEQDSIGLTRLSDEKKQEFVSLNKIYKEKFNFPFIICVKDMKSVDAILEQFHKRVQHGTMEEELNAALENVYRIGWWRLQDKVNCDSKL